MLEYKGCKYYASCEYRIGVGECQSECVIYRPSADLVYCANCVKRNHEDECPLLSLADYTEDDDFCSFGEVIQGD
jgi:hypothetical protein